MNSRVLSAAFVFTPTLSVETNPQPRMAAARPHLIYFAYRNPEAKQHTRHRGQEPGETLSQSPSEGTDARPHK